MIELVKALQIAEVERKDNPSVMEDCDFFFFTKNVSTDSNIFSGCKRVHVTGCDLTFLETSDGVVAFVEAKEQ